MAVNVTEADNLLKVDDGTKALYFNKAWCSIEFGADSVTITDNGKNGANSEKTILFTDFQFGGVAKSTEADIVTSLQAVIG